MTKRDVFGYLAILLALITGAGLTWYMMFAPHFLKVAVAPPDTGMTRFLLALSTTLEKERASVRLQVIQLATQQQVYTNIASKRSDLAVVRSDSPLPASTLAVASFQEFIAVTIARPATGIVSFANLAGKPVAVVGSNDENTKLFQLLAQLHGIKDDEIKVVKAESASEITDLAENKKIDAVFAVLPRGSPAIARIYDLFAEATEALPVFLPLLEFKSRPGLNPAFTKSEIAAGEISNAPKVPEKSVRTFTFPALIVARNNTRNTAVQEFTKNLFSLRLALANQYPAAARLSALPTKRDAPFPVHPGAAIYYDASEVSFLETYSDLMWLALFGFSGIASIFVWFWRLAIPKSRMLINAEREELIALIERARQTHDPSELADIEAEADTIVIALANQLFDGILQAERQASFDLLLNRLAAIIDGKKQIQSSA